MYFCNSLKVWLYFAFKNLAWDLLYKLYCPKTILTECRCRVNNKALGHKLRTFKRLCQLTLVVIKIPSCPCLWEKQECKKQVTVRSTAGEMRSSMNSKFSAKPQKTDCKTTLICSSPQAQSLLAKSVTCPDKLR